MTRPVFLYAPLSEGAFAQTVMGTCPIGQKAVLQDHSLSVLAPSIMPCLAHDPGASVEGSLVLLGDVALARLDLFLHLFAAQQSAVTVQVSGREVPALTYRLEPDARQDGNTPATEWTSDQAEVMRLATTEVLGLADSFPKAALRARWPMALAHAASQVRARAADDPALQRKDWNRSDVALVQGTMPYAWYFAIAEDDLKFRRFDGAFSEKVKRAGLVMSDAVTVLPYDPVRDVVMVIEQFRYGPWLRGARNAWLLEPVAGRVDPFESPEDCALRETLEEAQITLRKECLLPVGHVYPSPGAITEFLYQYVALTDLPDSAEGISGLESEAEDIRSHIIPFMRLMELIQSGEVANGPLVQSAYWLALNRDKLRADAAPQAGG